MTYYRVYAALHYPRYFRSWDAARCFAEYCDIPLDQITQLEA